MAYTLFTSSGTTWHVENGRITRHPDPYKPPEVASPYCPNPIVNEPFRAANRPEVGGVLEFFMQRSSNQSSPSNTGTIVRIEEGIV